VLAGWLYFHFPVSKSSRRSPDLTRWRVVLGQLLIPIGRGPLFLQFWPPPSRLPCYLPPPPYEGRGWQQCCSTSVKPHHPASPIYGVEGGPAGPAGDQLPHPPPHLACLHLVGKPCQRWSMSQCRRAYLPHTTACHHNS
jgi:hypothetical protein